jgi:hypothetical protein
MAGIMHDVKLGVMTILWPDLIEKKKCHNECCNQRGSINIATYFSCDLHRIQNM